MNRSPRLSFYLWGTSPLRDILENHQHTRTSDPRLAELHLVGCPDHEVAHISKRYPGIFSDRTIVFSHSYTSDYRQFPGISLGVLPLARGFALSSTSQVGITIAELLFTEINQNYTFIKPAEWEKTRALIAHRALISALDPAPEALAFQQWPLVKRCVTLQEGPGEENSLLHFLARHFPHNQQLYRQAVEALSTEG
ncbi:hypothetical protein NXS13_05950 [Corynebacterium sp. ES2730-CONJ]|uniref:hypothetical protein n=1 Tax=Corynebacterium sp. ES2730-CONJ TaxID=2973941 RepID=UPI00216B3D51|nr:hypothetical protein [Corynebacterium sp. ES2730-CONJ]MCS4532047.1 hypothetical protein [Corynebacterium sp. ES2730-CONJ]